MEIEGVLVNEFRICQSLFECMKDERKALSAADIESLYFLVEKREDILEELEQFETRREKLVNDFASQLHFRLANPRLSDCLASLSKPPLERIGRLCEGIVALQDSLYNLGEWNHALANAMLRRDESAQALLLNLYPPAHKYRPPVLTQDIKNLI